MDVDFVIESEDRTVELPPVELTGWESIVFVVEDEKGSG
jgi:hypothetical protein